METKRIFALLFFTSLLPTHTRTLTHTVTCAVRVGNKNQMCWLKRALGLHIHKHIEETDIGIIGFVFLFFSSLSLSYSLSVAFFAKIPALFTHHYYINFRILLFTLMNLFKFHEIFNSYLLVLFIYLCFFLRFCSCECVFVFLFLYIIYLVFINVSARSKNANTQICFDFIVIGSLGVCYAISRKQSSRNCT